MSVLCSVFQREGELQEASCCREGSGTAAGEGVTVSSGFGGEWEPARDPGPRGEEQERLRQQQQEQMQPRCGSEGLRFWGRADLGQEPASATSCGASFASDGTPLQGGEYWE